MSHMDKSDLRKISPDDPALQALNKITEVLGPFPREAQLRILASACAQLGEVEYARLFLDVFARECGSLNAQRR